MEETKETPMEEVIDKTNEVKHANAVAIAEHSNSTNLDGRLASLDLTDANDIKKAEALLTIMMRSDKGGIKSVNDGIAILMRAQELHLPFTSSIEHIHVINGKTGIDIHIIKALLLRAGVAWECVRDYAPLYEYTDGFNVYNESMLPEYCVKVRNAEEAASFASNDNDSRIAVYPVAFYKDIRDNATIYREYQLNSNFAIVVNKIQAKSVLEQKKVPIYRIPAVPVDYITEYKFTRAIRMGNEYRIQTSIGRFTYLEALSAGMFDKDTYQKYPKVLIGHRAFTYGARDIASDVIFGCMETTELKIVAGKELNDADVIEIEAQ